MLQSSSEGGSCSAPDTPVSELYRNVLKLERCSPSCRKLPLIVSLSAVNRQRWLNLNNGTLHGDHANRPLAIWSIAFR